MKKLITDKNEFKNTQKWVKNWNIFTVEHKELGIIVSLDKELNDTYKLRNSYDKQDQFCERETCKNNWKHCIRWIQTNQNFYFCDKHIKNFDDEMLKILTNLKKEKGQIFY